MENATGTRPAAGAIDEDSAAEPSLLEGTRDLLDDGRLALKAELAFQKSRLAYSGRLGARLAILGVLTVLFAHATLLALTVGLLFALSTIINPWVAMVLVTGLYLGAMALCALLALRKWGQISAAFSDKTEDIS